MKDLRNLSKGDIVEAEIWRRDTKISGIFPVIMVNKKANEAQLDTSGSGFTFASWWVGNEDTKFEHSGCGCTGRVIRFVACKASQLRSGKK